MKRGLLDGWIASELFPNEDSERKSTVTDSRQAGSDVRLLVKPAEAAEALAVSPRKLWAMTNSGEIPCVRLGRAVRYDLDDLRAWIDEQKRTRR